MGDTVIDVIRAIILTVILKTNDEAKLGVSPQEYVDYEVQKLYTCSLSSQPLLWPITQNY